MISTRDLRSLPDIPSFRRLTRALAMLDAIVSPEWEYRYYSFDSHWAADEMMASMRNGSGDHWFALFCRAGVALHGLAHEAPNFRPGDPWPGIFDALPGEFRADFLEEPAFETDNSTFCIWRRTADGAWSCGPVKLPAGHDPDGSADLLSILDGDPARYCAFAESYYESGIALADAASIYSHAPLTEALVRRLNPAVTIGSLEDDIEEIGYPDRG